VKRLSNFNPSDSNAMYRRQLSIMRHAAIIPCDPNSKLRRVDARARLRPCSGHG
jgi:hypothetical protein